MPFLEPNQYLNLLQPQTIALELKFTPVIIIDIKKGLLRLSDVNLRSPLLVTI